MNIIRLVRNLIGQIRYWDIASKIALVFALIVLCFMLTIVLATQGQLRRAAIFGVGAAILAIQMVVLWGNRHLVTDYTQAQRRFIRGEFETAREILEKSLQQGKPSVDALTLLGNVYHQLGYLDESEQVLRQALALRPGYHFPLFGLGRTLLVKGQYAEAIKFIQKSMSAGAPSVVQFDLGHAYYRQGDDASAQRHLQTVQAILQEPHRILMANYLLYRLGVGAYPSSDVIEAGLAYWEETAKRVANTQYGHAVLADIHLLQASTRET